jgi:hypothetical protein
LGVVGLAIGLNVIGVASIPGGPVGALGPPPPGAFGFTLLPPGRAGTDGTMFATLNLASDWPTGATLLSVTPDIATAPTVVAVLGTHPNSAAGGLGLGAVSDPGAGWRDPDPIGGATIPVSGGPAYLLVLVKVSPTTQSDAAVSGFWLDYSVGPFRFRSFDETSILVCAAAETTSSYPDTCSE